MSKVFISYVRDNSEAVERLAADLNKHGVQVWLDHSDLKPGEIWADTIRRKIIEVDYFIACFSKEYNSRQKTYMNQELVLAIEELRQRSMYQAWFIPIKLNECDIPDMDVGAGKTLRSYHWAEMYQDWESGINRILSTIRPNDGTIIVNKSEFSQILGRVYRNIHEIQGMASILKFGHLREESVTSLGNRIASEANTSLSVMKNYENNLFNLQEELVLYKSRINLKELIQECLEDIHADEINQHLSDVIISGYASTPIILNADKELLKKAIINLLINAIQYSIPNERKQSSEKEWIPVEINISISKQSKVFIEFINYGIPILEGDAKHIFEFGYMTQEAVSLNPSGLGTGLPTVKRIAQLHGGSVSYISSKDFNQHTFRLEMPIYSLMENSKLA